MREFYYGIVGGALAMYLWIHFGNDVQNFFDDTRDWRDGAVEDVKKWN